MEPTNGPIIYTSYFNDRPPAHHLTDARLQHKYLFTFNSSFGHFFWHFFSLEVQKTTDVLVQDVLRMVEQSLIFTQRDGFEQRLKNTGPRCPDGLSVPTSVMKYVSLLLSGHLEPSVSSLDQAELNG